MHDLLSILCQISLIYILLHIKEPTKATTKKPTGGGGKKTVSSIIF